MRDNCETLWSFKRCRLTAAERRAVTGQKIPCKGPEKCVLKGSQANLIRTAHDNPAAVAAWQQRRKDPNPLGLERLECAA